MPDDETINQMIARTEDEFELYQVGPVCFTLHARTGQNFFLQFQYNTEQTRDENKEEKRSNNKGIVS